MSDGAVNVATWDRTFLWRYRAMWLPDQYMDGDTFTCLPDTGYRGRHETRVRLLGVYAPERHDVGGPEATAKLRAALETASWPRWNLRVESIQLETKVEEDTSFERWVSRIWVVDSYGWMTDISKML